MLLPGTLLPLHVFERRYRTMVRDALAGEREIGMAMLKEGEDPFAAAPAIHPIGGAGEIVESEALEDGRYNVVLLGRFRYRVLDEAPPDPYRLARVERIPSVPFPDSRAESEAVERAAALYADVARAVRLPPLPSEPLAAERLASELALRLRYTPTELQALLETDSLAERYRTLVRRLVDWRGRVRFLEPFRPGAIEPGRN